MRCTGGSAQKGSNELEPIIRIEQLAHTYSAGTPFQRSAVDGVELDIMPGEFLGVIGHTGSGKSTLIQHLNGLLKPTQGHIYLNGKDIWADPKQIRQVRFQVGLVFQYPEYQLFEETVYKDIAFGPGNMGLDKEEIDRRVRESARMVGLAEELLEKSPFDLSGGQKRRVARTFQNIRSDGYGAFTCVTQHNHAVVHRDFILLHGIQISVPAILGDFQMRRRTVKQDTLTTCLYHILHGSE